MMRSALWLTLILLVSEPLLSFTLLKASAESIQAKGPIIDELVYKPIQSSNSSNEVAVLLNGQADMIPILHEFNAIANLSSNGNIHIYSSPGGSNTLSCAFFNCRRDPFDDPAFREAISHIIDRNYTCNTLLKGEAIPVEIFIPPISKEWINLNTSAPKFDTVKAMTLLDDAGYNRTAKGMRVNPQTGKPLNITIVTPTREDNRILWMIGYVTTYYINKLGINATQVELQYYPLQERTLKNRDFDIYIADVTLSRAPFGLYALLHSSRDIAWTYAYSGIRDPPLDSYLEKLWSSLYKMDVQLAALEAQTRIAELLPYVPVCSTPKISAISSKWVGEVNMRGYGIANTWTYLNIHTSLKPLGGSFTQTARGGFSTLNPCTVSSRSELEVIELINSPLFKFDAVTQEDMPVLAKNWTIQPWTTPQGTLGMKFTFNLRNDVSWQDGVPFTSRDVEFCINFLKAKKVERYASICDIIADVKTPTDYTVEIYLNEPGFRHIYDLTWLTILPEHIWANVTDYKTYKPWSEDNPRMSGLTQLVGTGPFIYMKSDLTTGVRLVWNPNYFNKNPDKPGLVQRVITPQNIAAGDIVTIDYRVYNYTGSLLSKPESGFKVTIRRIDGGAISLQPANYTKELYRTRIDTARIGTGSFKLDFSAPPYGSDSFTLVVNQPSTPPSNIDYVNSREIFVAISLVAAYLWYNRSRRNLHSNINSKA